MARPAELDMGSLRGHNEKTEPWVYLKGLEGCISKANVRYFHELRQNRLSFIKARLSSTKKLLKKLEEFTGKLGESNLSSSGRSSEALTNYNNLLSSVNASLNSLNKNLGHFIPLLLELQSLEDKPKSSPKEEDVVAYGKKLEEIIAIARSILPVSEGLKKESENLKTLAQIIKRSAELSIPPNTRKLKHLAGFAPKLDEELKSFHAQFHAFFIGEKN
ncbi:MAG TPA: hypothetical protein ENN46_00320 [Candidatus Woesearchaeota archaeon]|nr:hypothetical protein [Candidatus Woesearchaeota archaeon]